MNDNIPIVELPTFATVAEQLLRSIAYARECVSYRVGYEVEVESVTPVTREGDLHMRVSWRRRRPELRLVSQAGERAARDLTGPPALLE